MLLRVPCFIIIDTNNVKGINEILSRYKKTDDLDKACNFLQELIKDNLYTSSKNIQVLEQKSKLLEKLKLKIIFKDKS
ncbi:MAG: hypothetical protein ACI4S3_07135 [Candidatus Gastranaerophilaceae bacterium]